MVWSIIKQNKKVGIHWKSFELSKSSLVPRLKCSLITSITIMDRDNYLIVCFTIYKFLSEFYKAFKTLWLKAHFPNHDIINSDISIRCENKRSCHKQYYLRAISPYLILRFLITGKPNYDTVINNLQLFSMNSFNQF